MNVTKALPLLAAIGLLCLTQGARGDQPVGPPPPVNPCAVGPSAASTSYDFSGKALTCNPALMQQIDTTLIQNAGCRTMSKLGYANGYQCPAAGLPACMTMLKAGQVDACAQTTGHSYPVGCDANEASSPQARANSTCADFSVDFWNSLAIRIPVAAAMARLQAVGCKQEQGTTVFCPSHIREWACMPFQRGGVLTCRAPKLVWQCSGTEVQTCNYVQQ